MSIITNALRKAQEKRENFQVKENKGRVLPFSEESDSKKILTETSDILKNIKESSRPTHFKRNFIILSLVIFATTAVFIYSQVNLISKETTGHFVQKSSRTLYADNKNNKAWWNAQAQIKGVLQKPTLVLNGIMYTTTTPYTVINGITLSTGNVIKGYTVSEILPDSVKLISPTGENIKLELK
ncbi:MAG: hypothetical protein PHW46_02310 [Candidatus Omnitrophica bacterium]|nr:hypothetical protein [Candidatus Omnitrophota bacterium]